MSLINCPKNAPNQIGDDWFIGNIAHSLLARVIRISLPNYGFNDVDSVIVLINVFDQNHVKYNDVPEVAVTFYKGASNGKRLYLKATLYAELSANLGK